MSTNFNNDTPAWLILLVGVIGVAVLLYGAWKLNRWWNYSWGYESQVTATICEMVKPEYLVDPSECD